MSIAVGAQKDALANAYATAAPYGALFTADPGTTGTVTGEVTGGSPAYARVAMAWSTASTGAGAVTSSSTYNVPASTTVTFAGVCSASTGATLRDRAAVTSQTFASQGQYTVSASFTQT